MVSEMSPIMCDSRVGADVAHFLMDCGKCARDWLVTLNYVGRKRLASNVELCEQREVG